MLDRIFATAIFAIALTYTILAFFVIEAPFQYDPLGPESWPQILGIATLGCCAVLILKPNNSLELAAKSTLVRLAILVGLLSGYALAFKPLGFIISTFIFCTALSNFLGAKAKNASIFGVMSSIGGYVLCAIILDLNLPSGILAAFL